MGQKQQKTKNEVDIGCMLCGYLVVKVLSPYSADPERPRTTVFEGYNNNKQPQSVAMKVGMTCLEGTTQMELAQVSDAFPKVYAVHKGTPTAIVMEYIPHTLASLECNINEKQLLRIWINAVHAVAQVWKTTGLIHNDLAPQNIGIRSPEDADIALLDLGNAVPVKLASPPKWRYLSPSRDDYGTLLQHQRFTGDSTVSPAADFESLGYVMLEAMLQYHRHKLPWCGSRERKCATHKVSLITNLQNGARPYNCLDPRVRQSAAQYFQVAHKLQASDSFEPDVAVSELISALSV